MGLASNDARYDRVFISNYAANNIVDVLKRIRGVNDVRIFGERRYAMRLWLDPVRLNQSHLTATDVVNALQTPERGRRRRRDRFGARSRATSRTRSPCARSGA